MLFPGLVAAEGPAFYTAFVDDGSEADLTVSVLGSVADFGIGAAADLVIVVLLVARWARRRGAER